MCDICQNSEIGFPKSVYIYKKSLDEGEKYHVGPLWDFDACFNRKLLDNGQIIENSPTEGLWTNILFRQLMITEEFKQAYKARLQYFITDIYPDLLDFIDSYSRLIEASAKSNGTVWSNTQDFTWVFVESSFDYHEHIAELKDWIIRRIEYLIETKL